MMELKLTKNELHDLYDMLHMLEAGTLKINGCQESFNSIFDKLEPMVIPELHPDYKSTLNEQDIIKGEDLVNDGEIDAFRSGYEKGKNSVDNKGFCMHCGNDSDGLKFCNADCCYEYSKDTKTEPISFQDKVWKESKSAKELPPDYLVIPALEAIEIFQDYQVQHKNEHGDKE